VYELGQQMVNITTSNEKTTLKETEFHVRVLSIPPGQGGGQKVINLKEDTLTKQCIAVIKNGDNLCGARGIFAGLIYHGSDIFVQLNLKSQPVISNEITYIRKGRKLQKDLTLNLLQIPIPELNKGLKLEEKLDI
jgi:hypothetical protein